MAFGKSPSAPGTAIARLECATTRGVCMSRRTSSFLALALAASNLAMAEETYRHGRVRHTETGVSVQRATEPGAEEAVANLPFLPGDRV